MIASLLDLSLIATIVAILIFFNSLYVAAEFGTVASRRTRIAQLAATGNRRALRLLPYIQDHRALDRYVAACQIGITISSIAVGIYGQNQLAERLAGPLGDALGFLPFAPADPTLLADSAAVVIVVTLLTALQVIIGELLPKSVAVQYPEQMALLLVYPMEVSLRIFQIFIRIFNGSGGLILRLLGRDPDLIHNHVYSPEEIEILVTGSHEGGLLDRDERQMLRNTFRLRELTARQVMVHRTRFTSAPSDITTAELMRLALREGYTRIPIYEEKIDNILGFVHIKDVFRLHLQDHESEGVQSILREVVFVPETMAILDVWDTLTRQNQYMAIVFDEYGSTAGLITMEDLVEEIFGELQDEFDDESALVALDKQGRIYLRGDLLVADVNEYLDLDLPVEAADTLSGLVFSQLGRPPRVGDQVELNGSTLRVEAVEDMGVREVSLKLNSTDMLHLGEWELADRE